MSAPHDNAPARAFCPCCTGTGTVRDEYGDGWLDNRCTVCCGTGLNYPTDELYTPTQILLARCGWIPVVIAIGLIAWAVRA